MKDAMETCALGDDVYGDDPTVNLMQQEMAKFFGKEDALYVPSGTMSNLIAMHVSCRNKGDSVLLGDKCHIYNYERGGLAAIASIFPQVVPNHPDGTFDLKILQKLIPPPTEHIAQP
jgi:threonine aldolase